MRKVLVTGMSGTGKSGHGGWSEWSDADGGYVRREERITELLLVAIGERNGARDSAR